MRFAGRCPTAPSGRFHFLSALVRPPVATDPQSGSPRPFDTKTVEFLIGLMAAHDLTEIALQEGDQRIRLRKAGAPVAAVPIPQPYPPPGYSQALTPATLSGPTAPPAPSKKLHEIKSEMVGTFYVRSKPDKDPYVKLGQALKPDTMICQIEAMKIFNEIKAECTGTLVEVCVADKDPVDFGTVLFRVEPS